VDVFVQLLSEDYYASARKALQSGRAFAIATVIRGPHDHLGCAMLIDKEGVFYETVPPELEEETLSAAAKSLGERRSQHKVISTVRAEEVELFIEVVEPQPVLVIVGAVHSAVALAKIAQVMGYQAVIVDPRRAFGNPERFPDVDRLVQKWPDEAFEQIPIHERTAIALLTHDPKIDDPALVIALRSPAFYIGALGSATTQAKRRERMLQAGISEKELARLHGPIGLRLGGRTPEEVALSVMAEIIAVQNGAIQ
jgi:xanthine dehydrogenase accessory factor